MSILIDPHAQHARRLAAPPRPEKPPLYIERDRPICGVLLGIIGEPCARRPGHGGDGRGRGYGHRSAEALNSDARRRRAYRASP